MEIEIEIINKKKKMVDIEFPYFYKHIIHLDDGEVVIFGKIERDKVTTISEKEIGNNFEYEFAVEEIRNFINISAYFSDEHKSSEEEFMSAKKRLVSAATNA